MSCYDLDAEGQTKPTQNTPTFLFDQWIELHGLTPVKNLLCKYKMNTLNTLSLTSTEYIKFMSDPELLQNKSEYIPKVLRAIKSLASYGNNSANISSTNEYTVSDTSHTTNIIISQVEQDAIHKVKQNIIELDKLEINSNGLKMNYSQSIKRIQNEKEKQIQSAKQQINETFNNLRNALDMRQQHLLQQLNKAASNNKDDYTDIKEDTDPFQAVNNEIAIQRSKLNDELQLFNDTIKLQQSRTAQKRQEIILMMAKQSDEEFNTAIQTIQQQHNKMRKLISDKNDKIINIYYNHKEAKYDNLLNKINNFGAVNKRDDADSEEVLKQLHSQSTALLMDSLKFNQSLPFRWYKEEKQQHIVVKIIDENPLKIVQRGGFVKTDCEKMVCLKPQNINDMTDVALCVEWMREAFEQYGEKLKWLSMDKWDVNYKCNGIKINRVGDTIKSGKGYQSIFGERICITPYKYHWKLKQIADNGQDFYVGVERKGKEIVNNYFCKSETGYGFSGYYAQLYSNDKWGQKYGVKCTNKGDIIDVYLDMEKNELSYGINDKDYGKAYDVLPGEYRLAFTIHMDGAFGVSGERMVQLVSSTMSE
eukprot:17175_1